MAVYLMMCAEKDKGGGVMDDFGSKLEKDVLFTLDRIRSYERNKAIDDFVKALQEKIEKDLANPDLALECKKCGIWKNYDIKEIAEQLKVGVNNEY